MLTKCNEGSRAACSVAAELEEPTPRTLQHRAARAVAVAFAAIAHLAPAPAQAQSRELNLDAILVSGVVTYAWEYSAGRHWGVFIGAGWDELGETLTPDRDSSAFHSFEQILYIGGLHRWRRTKLDIDLGVRGGLGGVRSGGDLPDPFAGVYVAAMYGGKRFRFGPRAHLAVAHNFAGNDVIVHVEPIVVRVIFGW